MQMNRVLVPVVFGVLCTVVWSAPSISPKIYRADQPADLTIKLNDEDLKKLAPGRQIGLLYLRQDGLFSNGKRAANRNDFERVKCEFSTSTMTFRLPQFPLRGEGMHTFRVVEVAPKAPQKSKWKVIGKVTVYSLNEDLFKLRPFKGDFHAHSKESDGSGSPVSVYCYGRMAGHDFMTLSDHRKIATAYPACDAVTSLSSGLLALPGEEFHHPGTPLHSVSIGHREGICEYVAKHPGVFKKRFNKKIGEIQDANLAEDERVSVASSEVMYDIARELGSKLINYSHPFGFPNDRYFAPDNYNRVMQERHKFDAVECPNGTSLERVMMQLNFSRDLAEKGIRLNYVNVSDTHSAATGNLASKHTVVFAESLTMDNVCDAVKNGKSLAAIGLETPKKTLSMQYAGPERLARLCYYLSREYFPKHDKICADQGALMLKVLDGTDTTTETQQQIRDLKVKLDRYSGNFWAKP